jgi:mono/diheme cytochrome c family protein
MKRNLRILVLSLPALVLAIQLVPYGRDHTNPAVRAEPKWDRPQTRALAKRGCFDCHSNETVWPWYSHVAPVSWLVLSDVEHGRSNLNFSEWDHEQDDAHKAGKMVRTKRMPLGKYLWMHPDARLSATERDTLAAGLDATIGAQKPARKMTEGDLGN